MRKRFLVFAFLLCLVGTASEAQAQSRFGVQVSLADDFDLGLGARMALAPPAGSPVRIMASFDWFFPDQDGLDYWELNGNIVYMIPVVNSSVAPYVGGGLNVAHLSVDVGILGSASDTELGHEAIERTVAELATRPLGEIRQAVFDAVEAHGEQSDDRTLLLVRWMR